MPTTTFQNIRLLAIRKLGLLFHTSYLYAIQKNFPVSFLVHGFSIAENLLHPCRGYVEATGIYDGI